MLIPMTDEDWTLVLTVFREVCSKGVGTGRNDRRFLEAPHHFVVHHVNWRAASRVRQLEHRPEECCCLR